MKIEFNFEMSDWVEFQRNYLENSASMRKMKIVVTVLFPFLCLLIGLVEYLRDDLTYIGVSILTLFSILWVVIYPKRFVQTMLKRTEKLLNNSDNDGYLGPHSVEFNEFDMTHKAPESESTIKWVGIKRVLENEKYYFLYNTSVSALIIPKFKLNLTTEEMNELDNFIKSKTSSVLPKKN